MEFIKFMEAIKNFLTGFGIILISLIILVSVILGPGILIYLISRAKIDFGPCIMFGIVSLVPLGYFIEFCHKIGEDHRNEKSNN